MHASEREPMPEVEVVGKIRVANRIKVGRISGDERGAIARRFPCVSAKGLSLALDDVAESTVNRPGSGGGSQSMEDESYGCTEEVPRRVA